MEVKTVCSAGGPRPRDPVILAVPIRNTLLRLVKAGIKSSRTVVRVDPPNKGPSDIALNGSYVHVRCAYCKDRGSSEREERERGRERERERVRSDSEEQIHSVHPGRRESRN